MKIKQANIFQFGKLQNETITFSEGLNVIYGENEAGKSTLHDFLIAMLFGMEKVVGELRQEINMSGMSRGMHHPITAAACVSWLERPFFTWRGTFIIKKKKGNLKNEADQEELSRSHMEIWRCCSAASEKNL